MDSELERRGTAGGTVSAGGDLPKQTSNIPTVARSGEKKGMTEEGPVNRMQLNSDLKLLSVCIPVTGTDT